MLFSAMAADPHPVTRCGTKSLLKGMGGQVIEEVERGPDLVDVLSICELDLLVTEVALPGCSELEVLRRAHRRDLLGEKRSTEVLVLTANREDPKVSGAFQFGASGYALKSDSVKEIKTAIQTVLGGERYLSPSLPACLAARVSDDGSSENEPAGGGNFDRLEMLSPREREVLRLTARGLTCPEIGGRLSISDRTVETHRQNIKSKLEVENVVKMALYALRRGMISERSRLESPREEVPRR